MERVYIFDTTLRDGEQSPGASMNVEEKLRMAQMLERLGVDIIEAGFPISSPGDFESVKLIADKVRGLQVAGLARASFEDIDRAWEALKGGADPRIHTFIATSPIHMKHKLKLTPDQVFEQAVESVKHAVKYTSNVEWSAEDAVRSDVDYLCRIIEAVIDAGAKTVNIPDTVGYAIPNQWGQTIAEIMNRVPNIDKAVVSVHCHNDLGLATANSIVALQAGARQVECTINGIGERAGNTSLEEVVMAMKVRPALLEMETKINTEYLYPASRLVSNITGLPVQPNKAIVGANAFAHEAGIHQDGVLKDKSTYEIMTPESVGIATNDLVLGKHSGRHAFIDKIKRLGYDLEKEQLEVAFSALKELADKKKTIYDEDIEAIIAERILRLPDRFRLVYLNVTSGTVTVPTATVQMEVDGVVRQEAEFGDGPVDAVFSVIKKLTGKKPRLESFNIAAITGGTDAQAEVSVRIEESGVMSNGQASDTDIIVASAKAFVRALNKLEHRKQKTFMAHM
ncbi:MAG: 2-isopropylmalate synthase [Deltaproteobacteria bacterium]|nr:MAG: 2-isopropylmalate synthase [Deltaproteobacteria bacterium]